MRNLYRITLLVALIALANFSSAQITTTISGPSSAAGVYGSFSAAINALNGSTFGGAGTVFVDLTAGQTETAPTNQSNIYFPVAGSRGYVLTLSGTAANPIVIEKSGAGANPQLNAYATGTATPATVAANTQLDGVISLVGTSYVTIDGININDGNVAASGANMEYGIGLFKANTTTGCQNVLIQNCAITLTRNNITAGGGTAADGSCGIWSSNSLITQNVAVAVANANGANSNNKFYSNTISNCNTGIYMVNTVAAFFDQSNDVGGSSALTTNTISGYGGGGAVAAVGIRIAGQNLFNISYNFISSNTGHTNILRGILTASTAVSGTIDHNTITLISATAASVTNGIDNGAGSTGTAGSVINITYNTISCTNNSSTTGGITGINASASAQTLNVNNNIINNISCSSASSATLAGFTTLVSPPTLNLIGNTLSNFNATNAGFTGTIVGLRSLGNPTTQFFQGNTISNFSSAGTATTLVNGINNTGSSAADISGNTINTLSTAGLSIAAINQAAGTTINIYKNKVYDIASTNVGAPSVSGILLAAGNTVNINNNFVSDIKATSSSTTNAPNGINITAAAGTLNVFHNSVYMSGTSSGANFGSSAIFANTAPTVYFLNNIFVNVSTGKGTGIAVAYRRSSTASGTYNASSNNNLYYTTGVAGTFQYSDGTTNTNALPYVIGRDALSINTENPPFINAAGNNLHLTIGAATYCESGGSSSAAIADDIDGEGRPGPTSAFGGGALPDIGADEVDATPLSLVIVSVNLTPTTPQCVSTAHDFYVRVKAAAAGVSSVSFSYTVNGVLTTVAATQDSGSTASGNTSRWHYNLAGQGNGVVTWYFTATDGSVTRVKSGTGYQDAYLTGVTANITPASPATCAGSAMNLSVTTTGPGNATLGAGATTSATSGGGNAFANPFYHNATGGLKNQYIFTKAELNAQGLTAGNINSISFQVVNAGATYNNFQVSVAHCGATSSHSGGNFLASGVVAFAPQNITPGIGVFTLYFTTPFNWNNVNNIVITTCWSNVNTGGATAQIKYDNVGSLVTAYYGANSVAQATICGNAAYTSTLTFRPKIIFNGQITNLNSSFSTFIWTPAGSGTTISTGVLGGTTPFTVTATDANGCQVVGNTSVTVNPLPAAPSVTPGSKCPGVPTTTTVSSNSGLPTPTFNWYAASSGGVALQSSTATNYTTAIASTTTFWVTELNTTTGCESSPRVSVTATIISPDAVTAVPSATTICVNTNLTLTANKAAGPNVYTYTWTAAPAAGSGIPVSQSGSPIIITPTAPGTYTYTVGAVDGSCNTTANCVVNVTNPPTINSVTTSASPICPGSTVNLGVTFTGAYTPVYTENFNGVAPGWLQTNTSTGGTTGACDNNAAWTLRPNGYFYTGSGSFTFNSNDNSQFALSNSDAQGASGCGGFNVFTHTIMESPAIDLSAYSAAQVQFYHYYEPYTGSTALVQISGDNGASWQTVKTYTGTQQGAENAFVLESFIVPTGIPNYFTNQFKVRFKYDANWGFMWAVDNFTVSGAAATFSWTSAPAGFTSTLQNPTNVTPTSTTTYTVAVSSGGSCSASGNVTVNFLPGPPAPSIANNLSQCGLWVPNFNVISTSGSLNPGFNFYDAPSGGNLLYSIPQGASAPYKYGYAISTTTTFYVAEFNGTCDGTRTAVTVTVTAPPVVNRVPGANTTICLGNPAALSVSSAGAYNYLWSVLPLAGSGMAGTVAGAANPVTPTVINTYVYTIDATGTGANAACRTQTTITADVFPVPTPPTIFPTTANLCPGQVQTLTSTSSSTNLYDFGTQASTNTTNFTSTDYPAPFTLWYGGQRMQMYITSAELQAAGFTAGSQFNSIQFPVVSYGSNWSGIAGLQSYKVTIGYPTSGNTGSITSFQTFSSSSTNTYPTYQPYPSVGYSAPLITFPAWPAAGWTLGNDIVIEITFSNNITGGSNDVVVQYSSPTAYQSCIVFRADARTPAVIASTNTITYSYNRRPDFRLNGTTTYPITWAPITGLYTDAGATIAYTAGTPLGTVYAAPIVNTTYNAITTNSFLCTANSPNSTVNMSYVPTGATQLAGVLGAPRTSNNNSLSNSTYLFDNSNCKLISRLQQTGGNPANGVLTARVKIENTVQVFNLEPYVQRHFDIELVTNAATASTRTGRVTLYVLQSEFDNFNAYVAANIPAVDQRFLPTGPADAAGANRLLVTHYFTTSSNGSSMPGTYSLAAGASEVIAPVLSGGSVTWIPANNWWEITFDVTNLGGGAFFIHSNRYDAILPVQWLDVNAYHNNGKNYVDWTVTDQDMKQYEIERSADGSNFEKIGTVLSNGASNSNFTYHFVDAAPLTGRNYYRIKGISNDNRKGYSRTVVVLVSSRGFAISSLYPNPVTTTLNYEVVSGSNTKATIQIVDVTGKQVRTSSVNFIKGTNNIQTDISNLPQGQYRLQIITVDGYKDVKPFVKL